MLRYFAYGLNLDVAGMAARCPRARPVGAARLARHRFAINRHGLATVLPARDDGVWGLLWRIAPSDEAALDRFEGVGYGLYSKKRVTVHPRGGFPSGALVYLARERRHGKPRPGYLEQVVIAAREVDLPREYVARLERRLAAGTKRQVPALR